ncbi:uncharacterized protein LAESUDRAFT_765218 [Laetiporus sulphureus 93-53]|uniref:RING-type domain-containing protein n=2 Tax=Laetiporus sulphureus 93-53 TaxID=1314785 RepID=A0A165AVM9_9APHY|nr:uncharacterized protein LAESUDRAFT_765218 [Laetiporus sulphureus 93-53]KZS99752.1 hypothetical protein LAESUDRAFT_765218 [Laetiporus sulphureus 93-53]
MSTTRAPTHQPLRSQLTNATRIVPDVDVIILSSDDEAPAKAPSKPNKPKAKGRMRARMPFPFPLNVEVVEISSDEEMLKLKTVHRSKSTIGNVQQQMKSMQNEIARLKGELSSAKARAREMEKASQQAMSGSSLDDVTNCEICTLRMWTPSTLACGHTFCQNCLQGWFGSQLAQYMSTHPHHNMPNLEAYRIALRDPFLSAQQRIELESQLRIAILQHHPDYTCPSCRAVVKERPIEVYAIKSVVRSAAGAAGETSLTKYAPSNARNHGGHRLDNPWDGFFP